MELRILLDRFELVPVAGLLYLVSHQTGGMLLVNDSAQLFVDLAAAGDDNAGIVRTVAGQFGLAASRVEADLADFCDVVATTAREVAVHQVTRTGALLGPMIDPVATEYYQAAQTVFAIDFWSTERQEEANAMFHQLLVDTSTLTDEEDPVRLSVQQAGDAELVLLDGQVLFEGSTNNIMGHLKLGVLASLAWCLDYPLLVHAAAVEDVDGRALLFAAPSGSGKTTLTLSMVQRGYGYLGDDTQLIDLERGELWAFPSSANVKSPGWPAATRTFPSLADNRAFAGSNLAVKYLSLEPARHAHDPLAAKTLVFPRYDSDCQEPAITPVDPVTVPDELGRAGCDTTAAAGAKMSRLYLEYLHSMPAFRLVYRNSDEAIRLLHREGLLAS